MSTNMVPLILLKWKEWKTNIIKNLPNYTSL
jgi:hypothetical protein